jgi:hypothetical protein
MDLMGCHFKNNMDYSKLRTTLTRILNRPAEETMTYDMLDTPISLPHKLLVLKEKQRQMKVGEMWQEALGSIPGFMNLKQGHETGLDILSHERKIAIELKNRTNTDNASSKKTNFDKLAAFKKLHPEYTCIYANINASTEEKTMHTLPKKIMHQGVEIEHHIGYEFIKFICGNDADNLIEFMRNI